MRRTYLKWLSGAAFAGTMLLGLAGAAAENNAAEREEGPHVADAPLQTPEVEQSASTALDVQEAFEDVAQKAFAETFPQGKLSVVQREIFATAAVLTTAHRVALTGQRQRSKYRRALVYQAASRRALQDEHYAVAMYLSLHARAIGDSVIRANTSRYRRDYQPYDLDMIKRAGGVSSDVIVDYLKAAEDEVPAVRLLFTGGGEVREAKN